MNFRHRQLGVALALAVASTATLLSGCGGGGDGVAGEDTLSGTALTGAALVGANITVKNGQSQDCASATSDSVGAWSTGVKSCGAGPFLIKATGTQDGGPVTFYSAATAEDVNAAGTSGKTVNVSQITDLIVKIALKTDDPGTSSSAALADGLTQSKLASASKNALTTLVPASVLSARRHLTQNSTLLLSRDRLTAFDRKFEEKVDLAFKALQEAIRRDEGVPKRQIIRLEPSSVAPGTALSLTAFVPSASLYAFGLQAQVLLIVHERASSSAPDLLLWEAAFNFTPAQSRVALEVFRGHSVNEAAASLSIAPTTVKSQLKEVYWKTETTRQSQLVLALARVETG